MIFRQRAIAALSLCAICLASAQDRDLESTYQFLVNDRETRNGVLYTATAGELRGLALPLSFNAKPEYWGEYVCKQRGIACAVTDSYNPTDFTLKPQRGPAGDLQTERVNVHSGTNIYDAATWQIAVVLGQVVNQFGNPRNQDAYALATNQNKLLQAGHSGNALDVRKDANRATTKDGQFLYNQYAINNGKQAYSFRMISRSWLATDPLINTPYARLISVSGLPKDNPDYRAGRITWTDWKPITGENAWAYLLGPLHAAYLHYIVSKRGQYVPFADLSVQNALAVLPTFATMQSLIGAVYHVPSGTLSNQGEQLINPYQVSVENNASLYAGLRILESALRAELVGEKALVEHDKDRIHAALKSINIVIHGGQLENRSTAGLLSFFRKQAMRDGEFVQGGLANDPNQSAAWVPTLKPKAVDTNTWGIAALGTKQIDQWFGFGAAYQNWQQVKSWGAYGVHRQLWGVGFSDLDGNGMDSQESYRQGVLSAEWTAGAINMVRNLLAHYESIAASSPHFAKSKLYVQTLKDDEQAMLEAIKTLRADNYDKANFPGQPSNYKSLASLASKPYVYASKRYLIPFGWYANPIPSTCATAWVVMLADRFDPFGYGGRPN
jgi:hypothetical protein